MQGTCEVCKNQYEKRQESQRFCSKRCNNKYQQLKASGKVYLNGPRNMPSVQPPAPPASFPNQYPVHQPDNLFLGFIQNQNQQLTAENARIKSEYDKLQADHHKILIEKNTWEKLQELEKQKAEVEKANTLSGFAESPVGDRLLGMLETIVVKKFGGEESEAAADFFSGVDEATAEGLKTLCKQLDGQKPEFIGKVMAVVQLWVKYPQMLDAAVQSLEQIKQQLKQAHENPQA